MTEDQVRRVIDEWDARWRDELNSLLLAAFAEAEARRLAGDGGASDADRAATGRFMFGQFKKGGEFRQRQKDHLAQQLLPEAKPKLAPSGQPPAQPAQQRKGA